MSKVDVNKLFADALTKRQANIKFEMNLDGTIVECFVDSMDFIELSKERETIRLQFLEEAERNGDTKKPIVESDWESTLKETKERIERDENVGEAEKPLKIREALERQKANKPKNLAEQFFSTKRP